VTEYEEVACVAAREAGALLRRRFADGAPLRVEWKGLHDFVTEVDREAEQVVLQRLRESFPDHAIMSEEAAPEVAAADYRWVVDPLDGTTNFVHGVPTFSVSVALEDREGVLAAAVYDPMRNEMFRASRGGGACLNDETIRCAEPAGTTEALIATGFPYRELSRVREYLEVFEALIRTTAGLRRAGSAALDLSYTACGRYDGFWELGLSRWDIAAGVLLVHEAGGRITDMVGGNGYMDSGDIVAAESRLHTVILEITTASFG